jgi:alkanesulfonate monooxygenase SsuD/methylene tetrahydromethanopterin reductase-like flavin-dependent oxidoreductase (luciferase family)
LDFIKRCGLMVEPQEGMPVEELLDLAAFTERTGFGYFFRSDHLLPTSRSKGLGSAECWVTLGAIATRTKRIKFGPMVTPIGWRNPALLARMACTVNSLSKGRLQLGVGAGWYGDEYLAHGFPFPDAKTRIAQFREALKIIRPLTQTGRVDFEGKFFSAHLKTLPETNDRIHLIVGGRTPAVVRQTEQFGDEWNYFSSFPDEYDRMKRSLDGCGRKIEVSRMGSFMIAEDAAGLKARLKKDMKKKGVSKSEEAHAKALREGGMIVGTAADFPERVRELMERGVQKFYFQTWDPADREHIELLARVLKGM